MHFATLLLALLPGASMAHMFMNSPMTRGNRNLPGIAPENIDYNIHSPALSMCKGQPKGPVSQTLVAGTTIPVTITGPVGAPESTWATHHGGHCQWALSYDDGKTFNVIHRYNNTCVVQPNDYNTVLENYSVPLPGNAPNSDSAIFAWTWLAADGGVNEMFMGCADVKIVGGSTSNNFHGPDLVIMNMPGHPDHPHWSGGVDPNLSSFYPN